VAVVGVASGFYLFSPLHYVIVIASVPLSSTVSSHFQILAATLSFNHKMEKKKRETIQESATVAPSTAVTTVLEE